ncbi:hypothetical protein H5410_021036 [Solanum commersonii]|uniref:Uncharacterized protein n=1 Tax=Solanum commersonii TaxID=4109 RepID=A0A9J5Z9U1_SOLCO|nr:hypothetical protein H5410_021036 [Solanum commersonii]
MLSNHYSFCQTKAIKDMYDGTKTQVRRVGGDSENFPVVMGLHQGYVYDGTKSKTQVRKERGDLEHFPVVMGLHQGSRTYMMEPRLGQELPHLKDKRWMCEYTRRNKIRKRYSRHDRKGHTRGQDVGNENEMVQACAEEMAQTPQRIGVRG